MPRTICRVPILAAALLSSLTATADVERRRQPPGSEARVTLDPNEQQFVVDAARATLTQIELGRLAKTLGSSPAMREFGQRLMDEQLKLNFQLMEIAAKSRLAFPRAGDVGLIERLRTLRGSEFDSAFAREVVGGHERLLATVDEHGRAGHPAELRAFALIAMPILEQRLKLAKELVPPAVSLR